MTILSFPWHRILMIPCCSTHIASSKIGCKRPLSNPLIITNFVVPSTERPTYKAFAAGKVGVEQRWAGKTFLKAFQPEALGGCQRLQGRAFERQVHQAAAAADAQAAQLGARQHHPAQIDAPCSCSSPTFSAIIFAGVRTYILTMHSIKAAPCFLCATQKGKR